MMITREPFESTPAILALAAFASGTILLTVAGVFDKPEQRLSHANYLERNRCETVDVAPAPPNRCGEKGCDRRHVEVTYRCATGTHTMIY